MDLLKLTKARGLDCFNITNRFGDDPNRLPHWDYEYVRSKLEPYGGRIS